jgi:purine-binding chemotaxis protein CheW
LSNAHVKPAQLRAQLQKLETELLGVRRQLLKLGTQESAPGMHLVFEVAQTQAMIPVSVVQEVVPLVEHVALPGAPSWVLGTISYRGQPASLIDVASILGVHRQPPLDAHVLIVAGSSLVALVVDRVRTLVESPVLASSESGEQLPDAWRGSNLVVGYCRVGERLFPLVSVEGLMGKLDPIP